MEGGGGGEWRGDGWKGGDGLGEEGGRMDWVRGGGVSYGKVHSRCFIVVVSFDQPALPNNRPKTKKKTNKIKNSKPKKKFLTTKNTISKKNPPKLKILSTQKPPPPQWKPQNLYKKTTPPSPLPPTHGTAHVNKGLAGAVEAGMAGGEGVGATNMRTKFHRNAQANHQIHQRQGVQVNVPEVHEACGRFVVWVFFEVFLGFFFWVFLGFFWDFLGFFGIFGIF